MILTFEPKFDTRVEGLITNLLTQDSLFQNMFTEVGEFIRRKISSLIAANLNRPIRVHNSSWAHVPYAGLDTSHKSISKSQAGTVAAFAHGQCEFVLLEGRGNVHIVQYS